MNEHTIEYRGYEIDPVHDPEETGAWRPCSVEEATFFEIYPADINELKLDVEAYTLETAKAAVDIELESQEIARIYRETGDERLRSLM